MNVRIEQSWKQQLQEEFDKPYFEKLVTFVKDEYKRAHVLPLGHQIFHIFNSCPFEKVKVVILGQDPYPNPGQYYGVCFSVPDGVAIPGSLSNIFKEIHQDLGKPIPTSGNLDRWVAQGVFPLNSVLTVRAHETGSHRNMGWEIYMACKAKYREYSDICRTCIMDIFRRARMFRKESARSVRSLLRRIKDWQGRIIIIS